MIEGLAGLTWDTEINRRAAQPLGVVQLRMGFAAGDLLKCPWPQPTPPARAQGKISMEQEVPFTKRNHPLDVANIFPPLCTRTKQSWHSWQSRATRGAWLSDAHRRAL